MIAALKGDDVGMRAVALASLIRSGNIAAISSAATLFSTLSSGEQIQVLNAGTAWKVKTVLPVAITLMDAQDSGVRAAAIQTVGAVGDASSVALVLKKVAVNADVVRLTLSRMSAPGVDKMLIAELDSKDSLIKRTVASVLGDRRSEAYYCFLLLFPFAFILLVILLSWAAGLHPRMPFTFLIIFLILPKAFRLIKKAKLRATPEQPMDFIALDGETAQFNLMFGILCTLALGLDALVRALV